MNILKVGKLRIMSWDTFEPMVDFCGMDIPNEMLYQRDFEIAYDGNHLSSNQNPGCLVYVVNYTTQL